jgi:hypothetical protein
VDRSQVLDKLGFTDDESDLTLWGNIGLQFAMYAGFLLLAFCLLHRCLSGPSIRSPRLKTYSEPDTCTDDCLHRCLAQLQAFNPQF